MSQMLLIHDQLRDMILSLDLGPGERLSERWLEGRFESSRTPIRAALARLEGEGLVQRDGRNWAVAPIDLGEIQALSEYREPLEVTAVRLACERAAPADLDAVEEMLNACRPDVPREEWHKIGTDFHVEIARLSGNKFLAGAIEGVMTRLSRARWLEVWTEASREQAFAEHRRILGFIRNRQPDEAAREAGAHVRDTRDRLLRSLDADRRGLRARGFAIVGAR
ncbi:GntR family transcriptional regulator [Bradyrhizobium manausense]|uniref:GntR family transcriptional regulator n=1 Tax=Bradyrhizobium TaxID=374 RepID=UPI001BAC03AF|nr:MULTISPECIES: GntR family transcriptional regulator [Bradyrhizobium]MBR0824371.1 GntR family transcriptional regulator [Bradyrhizobium manausense]UVO26766.1 GntR family transcriptional regulator [Bradyrhizobium arachidis]